MTVAGLAIGITAAFTSDIAAAVVSAVALVGVVILVVFALSVRERYGGIYETLSSEHTWDLKTEDGSEATLTKLNRVKFLQSNVLAVPDYIWGGGSQHMYKCSPGREVDRFQEGHQTCVIISLGQMYSRGKELDLKIERTVMDAFLEEKEWIEVKPYGGRPPIKLNVIFPANRPATAAKLIRGRAGRRRKESDFDPASFAYRDGRQLLTAEVRRPYADETIRIDWVW